MQPSATQAGPSASPSRPATTFSDFAWPNSTRSSMGFGLRSSTSSSPSRAGKLASKHARGLQKDAWSDSDTRNAFSGSRSLPPRFSKLLGTVLGSSFSPNSSRDDDVMVDGTFVAVPSAQTVTRPPSPTPSMNFSLISPPSPTSLTFPNGAGISLDVFSGARSSDITPKRSLFGSSHRRGESTSPSKIPSRLAKHLQLPRIWDALSSPGKKSRSKLHIADGLPLDGEEGELIDDEACFINATAVSGLDILALLPTELSLYVLLFLELPSVLACLSVSKHWRALANDPLIWRELFYRTPGWNIDLAAARRRSRTTSSTPIAASPIIGSNHRLGHALEEWSRGRRRLNSSGISSPVRNSISSSGCDGAKTSEDEDQNLDLAPLWLNWPDLYKTRMELDRRWVSGEPKTMRISGHEDSVYCLEFDAPSQTIITGSRDKTIKIWSLRSGRLQATLRGHGGSVLCLKFDKTGFMVSGSSDCTVFVWDLNALTKAALTKGEVGVPSAGGPELVQRVLKGHTGGVLDLRIDQNWIVSCSKDALIRVWCRKTLTLFTTLRGHEGPVNAVGLQGGKVVSASGDGKMMLWDIASSTRTRTFEGHDRGLACIEFKGDYIVSGSNDCKIKVWSAETGECIRTLVGHDLLVRALSFDPESRRLVSASYDKSVKVWDLATGKMVREFKNSHSSHIFDVKFDACRIVSTSHDQKVVVLDFSQDLDTSLFI